VCSLNEEEVNARRILARSRLGTAVKKTILIAKKKEDGALAYQIVVWLRDDPGKAVKD